jgi:hypothetical protein
MGVHATKHTEIRHPGQPQILNEARSPRNEPLVFLPLDRGADQAQSTPPFTSEAGVGTSHPRWPGLAFEMDVALLLQPAVDIHHEIGTRESRHHLQACRLQSLVEHPQFTPKNEGHFLHLVCGGALSCPGGTNITLSVTCSALRESYLPEAPPPMNRCLDAHPLLSLLAVTVPV